MKSNYICWCFLALVFYLPASSQETQTKFHTIGKAGMASGNSGVYGSLYLINGVVQKKWFAGIGAGYDYYRYTTIPLFFSLERYFGKQNDILISADIGYNFPKKNKPGKEVFYYNSYHFTGGLYTAFSVGYKIRFYKNASFLLNTGYSFKKLHSKIGVVNPCLVGPCPEDFSNYDYNFGAITIKGGIDIGW